jgi:hypothetical protein
LGEHSALNTAARRFPGISGITTKSCFIVRDNNGQALAYVYFENEPGRRRGLRVPLDHGAEQ